MFHLYILKSIKGTYYIGITENVKKRFAQHNAGKVHSTKSQRPWLLIHQENFATRSEAAIRERHLKSLKKRVAIEKEMKHF
ncbi:GIY-YIG nuclease family protein [Patescibacteria group bacterium]|nr:GIY-YIG nuclease family protein [Patescibacteria group bacterium]